MKYLALGDSYTYGEKVPPIYSFPYLLVRSLRARGVQISAPEVVAMTAWTTSELLEHMRDYPFEQSYDLCTLLIGVNNQYRSMDMEVFQKDFDELCRFALQKVDMDPRKLLLLNIPDWGLTPYNKDREPTEVSAEIDQYNQYISQKSKELQSPYIDICSLNRQHVRDKSYLVDDGLHPSSKEYQAWVEEILTETLNLG